MKNLLIASKVVLIIVLIFIICAGGCVGVKPSSPCRISVLTYNIFHGEDANGNSKMDRGWFTQPLEKYAFSNDAWETLAKPDLQSMLIPKTGDKTRINLTLKSVTDF